jgi:glycosyltransferase involved in cell wall biosynthesis
MEEKQTLTQGRAYVLMTAAYNEEAHIEKTLQSVVAQTVLPRRWVIVSDHSTDRTDGIVQGYAERYEFIRFLRVTKQAGHNFGAKIIALQKGEKLLQGVEYAFIGNLDADLSLEKDYFEKLLAGFVANPKLGLASGFVYEDEGTGFRSRWFNSVGNVPHAAQLVRRECYEAIGGYAVLKYGGEDWYAQTCAKMKGWEVAAVPELRILHHRITGGSSRPIANAFRLGKQDYSFGSDPIFEIVKCLRRVKAKPYVVSGMARLLGFVAGYFSGEQRAVPKEFAAFLRKEQRARVWSSLNSRGVGDSSAVSG